MRSYTPNILISLLFFIVVGWSVSCFADTVESVDSSVVRTDNLELWDEVEWAEMTPAERELWSVLGWTQSSWDEEGAAPASESKNWDQLSKEEQATARRLGYDEKTWDR